MKAQFDQRNHTTRPGWATYQTVMGWRERLHGLIGHSFPDAPPDPANGYSPSNYGRCYGCRAPIKWYREGQHRFGSLDRWAWELSA